MTAKTNRIVLLGPQRNAITVTEELDLLGVPGKIATITAGWQEREAEDSELQDAIGHRAVNLALHARLDRVFALDPELFRAHRARQDKLRRLQDLYRVRLNAYIGAAQELFHHAAGDDDEPAEMEPMLAVERADAVQTVQRLDAHHLAHIVAIHEAFEREIVPGKRPALVRERAEIAAIMDQCALVAIAGGHVATLLGRLRLLDVAAHFGAKPVLGWSAGAMVLTDRVILFHDRPPEGPGNAEVMDIGLGLAKQVVALPHATKRLILDDGPRMALFAQRFLPALCVALDPYCRARATGKSKGRSAWELHEGTWMIDDSGRLTALEHAAEFGADDFVAPLET